MNKRINDVKKAKTRDRRNNEDVTFKKEKLQMRVCCTYFCVYTIYFSDRNKFGIYMENCIY